MRGAWCVLASLAATTGSCSSSVLGQSSSWPPLMWPPPVRPPTALPTPPRPSPRTPGSVSGLSQPSSGYHGTCAQAVCGVQCAALCKNGVRLYKSAKVHRPRGVQAIQHAAEVTVVKLPGDSGKFWEVRTILYITLSYPRFEGCTSVFFLLHMRGSQVYLISVRSERAFEEIARHGGPHLL